MSICSLDFLNFAPPECIDRDAGFYHTLFLMTTVPLLAPPLIYAHFRLIKRDPNAGYKTLAMSLHFFELVLGSVTTRILKTFDCKGYGHESHLKAQLTLMCDFRTNAVRRAWVVYASVMTVVYPIGVPALMLFVLYRVHAQIERVMTRAARTGETVAEIIADVERAAAEAGVARAAAEAGVATREDKNPAAVTPDANPEAVTGAVAGATPDANPGAVRGANADPDQAQGFTNPELLLALCPLYEKYGGRSWYFGVVAIYFRLLETSFLVFIERDLLKALWATFVSTISIIALRELDPWLNRTDGKVAYAGQWLVFFWIFAMLSMLFQDTIPLLAWGLPLTLLTVAFFAFTIKKYKDDVAAAQLARIEGGEANAQRRLTQLPHSLPVAALPGPVTLGRSRFSALQGTLTALREARNGRDERSAGRVSKNPSSAAASGAEEPDDDRKPAALPEGWRQEWDEDHQREVYRFVATNEISYNRPAAPAARSDVELVHDLVFGEFLPASGELDSDLVRRLAELEAAADPSTELALRLVVLRKTDPTCSSAVRVTRRVVNLHL